MNQRVLVTAGASGIGREIARAFAAQGAKVFVCDIDPQALETLAQEIPGVTTVVCDVSKRQDIEHMVEAAVDALGGLDVLVNNAGISGSTAPVEKSDPDEWEKVVQVNLIGTFNVTRLAIPHLKKSSAGVIIIMSSGAGRFGVRATPRDLLIIATHLERVADDPNTPHTLTVLFGHVAAAIGRGCRTVLPPIPFQILLEQTEAMLDGAWGKNFDALYAEMMSFQEPPDDDSEPATGPLT